MKKGELRELYQMMFPEYPDIVTVKELREMLGISRKLAYKLIDYGYIHAVKIGTTLKIPKISVINYVMDNRENYGTVDILYGSRSKEDLVGLDEIQNEWTKDKGVNVYLTIDREQPEWDGHVGFVPSYLKELEFSVDKTVLVCGPPIMIKFVLAALQEMGFEKTQVYTTLELRMKCGIGKCGRCNIGSKYVCKDGPVFRCDEVDELPDEY